MTGVEPTLQMWATLALTGVAVLAYAWERTPVEITALGVLGALLLLFHLMPLAGPAGEPVLGPGELLAGFASPALIAVLALLVIGEAMVSTAALDALAHYLVALSRGSFRRALILGLTSVAGTSAFLNNTPVVVIFIPILRTIAQRFGQPASAVMMPLCYAAILGGMITLIGSSSNLLVSGELVKLGYARVDFFAITVPALVLVAASSLYVLALPKLLPHRDERGGLATDGKQFIAEIDVVEGSPLVGAASRGGLFPALAGVTVRLIQRSDRTILPPFESITLQPGDILIVAATRKVLTEMLARNPGHLLATSRASLARDAKGVDRQLLMLAEAMVKPASRMVGQTLDFTNFEARSRCTVLGIQRRARMLRTRVSELRLEPGDVLLLLGRTNAIERLRGDPDVLLMEWSASEMPRPRQRSLAVIIFALTVLPAALDLVPIVITAIFGVIALIVTGCINIRQAARAVDRRIVLLIASAIGLGTALEATGGASYLASLLLEALAGAPPAAVLSAFFLLMTFLTNILSNNACAVLFTPVAVSIAERLQVDVFPFALAVIFAANCSFATPIGYQVNLLVMGPGQYRFVDFVRAGVPLTLLVWLAFSLFAPWYYGL